MDAKNVIDQLQELIRSVRAEHGIVVGGDVPHLQQGRAEYQLMCQIVSEAMSTKVRHLGAFPSSPFNSGFLTIHKRDNGRVQLLGALRGDGRGWGFPGFGYPDKSGVTAKENAYTEWVEETGTFLQILNSPTQEPQIIGVDISPADAFFCYPMEEVVFDEVRNGEQRFVHSHLIVQQVENPAETLLNLQATTECLFYQWFSIEEVLAMIGNGEWAFATDELYVNIVQKFIDLKRLHLLPTVQVLSFDEVEEKIKQFLTTVLHRAVDEAALFAKNERDNVLKVGAETKSDGTFVTYVDKANSERIKAPLGVVIHHPYVVYLDEEYKFPTHEVLKAARIVISVDPLDGTTNYKNGGDTNAVSVGVYVDGKPFWGCVQRISDGYCLSRFKQGNPVLQYSTRADGVTAKFSASLDGLESRPVLAERLSEGTFDVSSLGPSQHPSAALALIGLASGDVRAYLGHVAHWDIAGAFCSVLDFASFKMMNPVTGQIEDPMNTELYDDTWRLKEPMLFCQPHDFAAVRAKLRLKDGSALPPLEDGIFKT